MRLRSIEPRDRSAVLALNAGSVEHLSPMNEARLDQLLGWAHRGEVLEVEGAVAGFVLVLAPGCAYDSVNYRWFGAQYEAFLYLDRIVVAPGYRRRGCAGVIYDAMERAAEPFGRLVCEVNAEPPNPGSLAFHVGRGYREVGRLSGPDDKVVAMLSKELGRAISEEPRRRG